LFFSSSCTSYLVAFFQKVITKNKDQMNYQILQKVYLFFQVN